ncbi:MAG: AAA family ATPase, partial [Nocardioides sp.]
HNHHTIEPLLEIFGFGTPAFRTLNGEFRRRVIEEAARGGTRLVFTFVWNVEVADDADEVRALVAPYVEAGLRVSVVELYADLPTRLVRNLEESRIAEKRSKRDLAWSDAHVRELDAAYVMNTDPARPTPADDVLAHLPHLRLDNTALSPDAVADAVLEWLG